jgi:hypothetical protein
MGKLIIFERECLLISYILSIVKVFPDRYCTLEYIEKRKRK